MTASNHPPFPTIHNTWADYLLRDLMLLKDCDAIVMLPDWKESKGAQVEHAFAEGMGIEIVYLPTEEQKRKCSQFASDLGACEQKRIVAIAERVYKAHCKLLDDDAAYHSRMDDLMMDPFAFDYFQAGFIVTINYMLNEYGKRK